MPTVALLSTSDTDLLSARSAGVDYVVGNPARLTDEQIAAAGEFGRSLGTAFQLIESPPEGVPTIRIPCRFRPRP